MEREGKYSERNRSEPITILIVEDHPATVAGLLSYLATADDIEVVGTTNDGEEAVDIVREHVPDVVLMDLVLTSSAIDGVEATRRITRVSPSTQVLALTAYDRDALVFPTLKAGALGYVLKTASTDQILTAIRSVARRQPHLDPHIYHKIQEYLQRLSDEAFRTEPVEVLTPREREVLDLLVEGLTNQQIAERLVVSLKTVKTHVSNILAKLHLPDRTQARLWALHQRSQDQGQDLR